MKVNTQLPKKQYLDKSGSLKIVKMFLTIQGEGPFAGTPAFFIRLAGCNLQCPFCDTNYTTDAKFISPFKIIEEVNLYANKGSLIVITGGEPFRQNLTPLVNELLMSGYKVQIETNGTLHLEDFPYDKVTIVCSPKTPALNKKLLPHIDAFKYVVSRKSVSLDDGLPNISLGLFNKTQVARPPDNFKGDIFIQPLDAYNEEENLKNRVLAVASALKFDYRICLQIHKILNME